MISISIVSHSQIDLVVNFLDDVERFCKAENIEVILTINVDEVLDIKDYSFRVTIIKNQRPKGFGANHNQAFNAATGRYFCVMNPDIRLTNDPFPALMLDLKDIAVGVAAPVVLNDGNLVEDSARLFPSPMSIFIKFLNKLFHRSSKEQASTNDGYDWVGGMFMLFRSETYKAIEGFDERYFMYYEDVDICARLTNLGKRVVLCREASAIHLAQRASHRSLKHLRWHIASMLRFFLSRAYWRVLWR